jgi:hypothetical protein
MSTIGYTALAVIVLWGAAQLGQSAAACDCEKKAAKVKTVAATGSQTRGVLREWRGSQSGVAEAGQRVARTQAEWDQLWSRMTANQVPASAPPKVDWKAEMVVALFMGGRPTGGYGVTIKSVTTGEKEIVVAYEETAPPPDAITIQALTQPYAMAVIKRSSLPVRFTLIGTPATRPPGL